jgi:hypothetical protein
MSLKSVKTMPALSPAAKTTIINTIADNALASFVVIQVGLLLCTQSCFMAASQQHETLEWCRCSRCNGSNAADCPYSENA